MTRNLKRWVAGELLLYMGTALVKVEHEMYRLFKHPEWSDVWSDKEREYMLKRYDELRATREKMRAFRERRCK
jgi:hypothetical protein